MASVSERKIDKALSSVLNDLGISLKPKQEEALKAFLLKQDVCAVLPTGYGKSLIYQLAPLVAKKMKTYSNPVVVVVSPLVALMGQQVKEAQKLGITAVQLGVNSDNEIVSSAPQLIFGSPESWLLNDKWRRFLTTLSDLVGVVVDEVHLTYKWGQSDKGKSAFRESFARLGEMRSIVKPGTPILALTASADLESRARVETLLLLQNSTTVTESPNRHNIRIGLKQISRASLDCLDWIVKELKEKGPTMSPIIIYGRTLKDVGRLYCYLKAELQDDAWVDRDPEHRVENLLIGMYHSKTLEHNKDRVISSFSGNGNCRVVAATTALGMGLNFPKISHVVLYGVPEDLEAVVQEIGRAGSDGTQSHAVVYCVKPQHTKVDEKVKTLLKVSESVCIRKSLFANFEQNPSAIQPGHLCCTYCHLKCQCHAEGCKEPTPEYELPPKQSSAPGIEREVSDEDKLLLKELLEEYQNSLLQESSHLFTSKAACTGFGAELVEAVLEHSIYIFDLKYIITHLPVFSLEHAQNILRVIYEVFEDIDDCPAIFTPRSVSLPDINYTGYFDDMESETSSQDSLESGVSPLQCSD